MKKPIIGITASAFFDKTMFSQKLSYANAVWAAGGEAILLPCNTTTGNIEQIISLLDGLLVPGGKDMDPELYGEEKIEACNEFYRQEDEYEMALVKEAVKQHKPVFAICRGMQLINALYGGTLWQDIKTQYSDEITHTRTTLEKETYHTVNIESDSQLAAILGMTENVRVNSSHHQAVKDLAKGFKVTAKAEDGIIEAMENKEANILCVQWHPERMQDEEHWRKLFQKFVEKCTPV